MVSKFHDHPRKQIIRGEWDTPLLRSLHVAWGKKFFYFGLPGPQVFDICAWRDMIDRVVAFELESDDPDDPRVNLVELGRQLALLGLRNDIYCGPLEEVVLRGSDHDGKVFNLDELVTLYNLDFCGPITEQITTTNGRQCLRFEALREIAAIQRRLYRLTNAERFILLITARQEFHRRTLLDALADPDLPKATRIFTGRAGGARPIGRGLATNLELLKAFVFSCVRQSMHGQNIGSVFLPPVAYTGSSAKSPMIHFAVVCKMGAQNEAPAAEPQTAEDFFRLNILHASDTSIGPLAGSLGDRRETNSAQFVAAYQSIA